VYIPVYHVVTEAREGEGVRVRRVNVVNPTSLTGGGMRAGSRSLVYSPVSPALMWCVDSSRQRGAPPSTPQHRGWVIGVIPHSHSNTKIHVSTTGSSMYRYEDSSRYVLISDLIQVQGKSRYTVLRDICISTVGEVDTYQPILKGGTQA
jgi:hypothetical protein